MMISQQILVAMEQKAEELYEDGHCTPQTTVFSTRTGVYGFKVKKTVNVLEGLKGSFRIRGHRADKQ